MKSEEKSGVTSPFPQTLLNQRGPAWSASNIHKYTGKAWGNHRPSASISRTITLHSVARVTRAERRRLVKRAWYREPDYTFGQLMLTLRTRIRLTQAGLAKLLGISRHAVAEWEAGRSYPTAEHLQTCIALGVQQQAFASGRRAEEIRALWHAAHQKVLLDEAWLQRLLSQQPSPLMEVAVEPTRGAAVVSTPQAFSGPRLDWGEALDVPTFYDREQELATLARWVVEEGCRMVSVLGMGGMGKSALGVRAMQQQLAAHFAVVIFRSLRDAPECSALLDDCLQ